MYQEKTVSWLRCIYIEKRLSLQIMILDSQSRDPVGDCHPVFEKDFYTDNIRAY